MNYSIHNHIHNFAVWTAARASQIGLTTTENIKHAIEQTELQAFSNSEKIITPDAFDAFHRETANKLIAHLKPYRKKMSYGIAAKIIAIYLKCSVIIRNSGEGNLAKIIHPPIDNILLTNIHKKDKYKPLGLGTYKWTQLDEETYFQVIVKLRSLDYDHFWEVERFWTPNR